MSVFTKDYPVRFYEVDQRARLRPVTLLDFFQDAAGGHTIELGIAVADLRERNLTWVLSRTHVRFLYYPRAGAVVRVRTWPSGREGLFALRDFEARDERERLVAQATTSWAVVDLTSGRPVRLDNALPDYPVRAERALASAFPTLPKVENAELELDFRVRRGDLDINQHVNNTVYPVWALEAIPADIDADCRLVELEIAYRAPVTYGDRILSRLQTVPDADRPTYLHQLVGAADGRELTRLRSAWERRG
jgi:acyl-ACP thioesterase